jgi:hypothetical protein
LLVVGVHPRRRLSLRKKYIALYPFELVGVVWAF